jgi:hypothetical protein
MSLIHKIMIGAAAMTLCGCLEQPANPPVTELNDTPIAEDPAMQIRNWDKSHLYYANVGTDAGPQGMSFQLSDKNPQTLVAVEDPFLCLGNTILLPLHLMRIPPWATIEARGSTVPPSYTAMPKFDPQ